MDPQKLPKLEHGIPDPETYLPGTPMWVWLPVGLGLGLLVALSFFLYRKFRPAPLAAPPTLPSHFKAARKKLAGLEKLSESHPLSELSSEASLSLRKYLAAARNEPSLYQTTEEFNARNHDLPTEVSALLQDLADTKYAKSRIDPPQAEKLIARSQECLDHIHASQSLTS